jgi:Flp pilus assembly protein TadG
MIMAFRLIAGWRGSSRRSAPEVDDQQTTERRKRGGFWRDERGNVVIFVVLSLPVFFMLATIAVDVGYLWSIQAQLRAAADAAALAAVHSIDDKARARARAIEYATKNMPTSEHGDVLLPADVALGNWSSGRFDASGDPLNAVQVILRRASANGNPVSLFFAQYVGMGSPDVTVEAIATVKTRQAHYCVLALDRYDGDSLKTEGKSELKLNRCGIAVNSGSNWAFTMTDQSQVKVRKAGISVVGDIRQESAAKLKADFSPTIGANAVADPFSGLNVPYGYGCNFRDTVVDKDSKLYPGDYCGGLTITNRSDVELGSGVYVIKDGDLRIEGDSDVRGEGVTIILTKGTGKKVGSFWLSGHSMVRLTAPVSGPFKGVQIFQDRAAPSSGQNQIVGASKEGGPTKLYINGALYFPSQTLLIGGDSQVETKDGGCVTVVARKITLADKAHLKIKCDKALAGPAGPQRLGVRLTR